VNNGLIDEFRRRGVLRVAALYVIAAWLIIQVADVFFPAWAIPESALRYLLTAAILGFPIAIVFGWMYDITAAGIVRTAAAGIDPDTPSAALRRGDHLTLAALAIAVGLIIFSVAGNVLDSASEDGIRITTVDKLPNSVAVLPFVNISGDSDNEYFCDGISEEILHRLADYRDMHVLARTSSFAFKGNELGAARLSDILGVKYLLQGSVRKVGDDLRISAQLIDENDFQVWSKVFDRKLSGVFAIQSEIAAAVASSLADTMSASLIDNRNYEPDIDAYQEFLLGREYLRARTPGFEVSAIEHFEAAIKIDDGYAEPYAGRAIALLLTGRDAAHLADRQEEAERSIVAALALEPEHAIGLAAQGLLLLHKDDYVAAEPVLRKALQLDPNLVGARNWLGNALGGQHKIPEAFAQWEEALARDPLDPVLNSNLANRYLTRGDFHRAEAQLKRLLDLPKPPQMAYSSLFHMYDTYGRYVEMIDAGKQWVLAHAVPESEPHFYYAFLAYGYARLGMTETSEHWQDRAEAVRPVDAGTWLRRSYLYRLQGKFDAMEETVLTVAEHQGLNLERMSPFFSRVIGAVKILSGEPEDGIRLMESTYDLDTLEISNFGQIDFLQILAFGYKKVGEEQRAGELLELIASGLERMQQDGRGRDPDTLALIAQNRAVAGDHYGAVAALEVAVASGFRGYFWVLHDARWYGLRDDQRFTNLMAQMKADIDSQRARVEQIDATDDFEALLDQALDRSSH
jgi:TolB-like protein/Flp pilus assembly protein TadD